MNLKEREAVPEQPLPISGEPKMSPWLPGNRFRLYITGPPLQLSIFFFILTLLERLRSKRRFSATWTLHCTSRKPRWLSYLRVSHWHNFWWSSNSFHQMHCFTQCLEEETLTLTIYRQTCNFTRRSFLIRILSPPPPISVDALQPLHIQTWRLLLCLDLSTSLPQQSYNSVCVLQKAFSSHHQILAIYKLMSIPQARNWHPKPREDQFEANPNYACRTPCVFHFLCVPLSVCPTHYSTPINYIPLLLCSTPCMFCSVCILLSMYIPLRMCYTPCVLHSICVPLRVCPTPCLSHPVYVSLRICPTLCVFHSLCVPLRVCSTPCLSLPVCPTFCMSHSLFHSFCVLPRISFNPCVFSTCECYSWLCVNNLGT